MRLAFLFELACGIAVLARILICARVPCDLCRRAPAPASTPAPPAAIGCHEVDEGAVGRLNLRSFLILQFRKLATNARKCSSVRGGESMAGQRDPTSKQRSRVTVTRHPPAKVEGKLDQSLAVVVFCQTCSLIVTESAGMNHGLQQLNCLVEVLLQCDTVLSATRRLIGPMSRN